MLIGLIAWSLTGRIFYYTRTPSKSLKFESFQTQGSLSKLNYESTILTNASKILIYSARKIKTNPIALYSILKPDTNSLSPSLKSKGVRLVSASKLIINIKVTKGLRTPTLISCKYLNIKKFKHKPNTIKVIIIVAKDNSKEIVWATPRILPIIENLLLELQPLKKIG